MSDELLAGQVRGLDRRIERLENGEDGKPGVNIRLGMLEKQKEINTELIRQMVSNNRLQTWFNIIMGVGNFIFYILYGVGMFYLFTR